MNQRWSDSTQLRRHDEDEYAHGAALKAVNKRMDSYERWQQRVIGVLGFVGFCLTILAAVLAGRIAHILP